MAEQQSQFRSIYHDFDDDYKAEILKMRLFLSKIRFECTQYKRTNTYMKTMLNGA